MPETNSPIFASLKSARRVKLKSQTAPSSPFRGKGEHIGMEGMVNRFLNYFANFFSKDVFQRGNGADF